MDYERCGKINYSCIVFVSLDNATNIDMFATYTMVETEAYFEAYRHVLAGLKGNL